MNEEEKYQQLQDEIKHLRRVKMGLDGVPGPEGPAYERLVNRIQELEALSRGPITEQEKVDIAMEAYRLGTITGEAMKSAISEISRVSGNTGHDYPVTMTGRATKRGETFISPTWKREGTEAYFAEAEAAGYLGRDKITGEAFQIIFLDTSYQKNGNLIEQAPAPAAFSPNTHYYNEPNPKGARKTVVASDTHHHRVLVQVYAPHVDEQSDGALGPKMLLAYAWPKSHQIDLRVGDWCLLPKMPHGPAEGAVGIIESVSDEQARERYNGETTVIDAIWRDGKQYAIDYRGTPMTINSDHPRVVFLVRGIRLIKDMIKEGIW